LVEGGNGTERVFCDDRELPMDPGTGIYRLPLDLPTDTRLIVKAIRDDEVLKQRTFSLSSDFNWQGWTPVTFFDRLGQRVPNSIPEEPSVAGGFVRNLDAQSYGFWPHSCSFDADEVYCIGQTPGQIVQLNDKSSPETWSPIWIVTMKKQKGQAIFCGSSISTSHPVAAAVGNSRDLKLWGEVLWHWRKRIKPPPHPGLRTLWKQFQRMARHV
jgi:hypothetical protein